MMTFLFTLASLVPVLGYIGFIFNLLMYFSVPRVERSSIRIFLMMSLYISIVWTGVFAVWYAVNNPDATQEFIRYLHHQVQLLGGKAGFKP